MLIFSKTTRTWSTARLRHSAVMQFAAIYSSNGADLHLQTDVLTFERSREQESVAQKGEHSSSAAASLAQTATAVASRRRGVPEKTRKARRMLLCFPPRRPRLQLRRSRLSFYACSSAVPTSPSVHTFPKAPPAAPEGRICVAVDPRNRCRCRSRRPTR
jgi:hypothetical protein